MTNQNNILQECGPGNLTFEWLPKFKACGSHDDRYDFCKIRNEKTRKRIDRIFYWQMRIEKPNYIITTIIYYILVRIFGWVSFYNIINKIKNMPVSAKEWLESIAGTGALGALGGVAMYLNQIRKGKPFKTGSFIINIFVAGWLGIVAKDFIPVWAGDYTYSIVSMVGFLAFPILDFLEDKGIGLIFNKLLGSKN